MRQLVIASVFAAVPLFAYADAADDFIEARAGYMKMLAINMATLAGTAKGEIPFDQAAVTAAASNIEALSKYSTLPALFVPGSGPADGKETEALPAVWDKPEDFAAKYTAFQTAAAGAGEAVAGGPDALGPVLQKLGGACKACHDDFRKED